jgi:excisionase family DNA binding protein
MAIDKPILNTREAAEYLGFKKNTLDHWRGNHRVDIPSVKLGRAVRYLRSDLDEYLARNKSR